jgi:hypothetical protein
MTSNKRKTLDELQERIHQGLDVSDDDLQVLFAGEEPAPAAPQTVDPATTAPAAAIVQAPDPNAAPAAPSTGEPDLLAVMPDKFKSKDAKESISKLVQSYAELEARLAKQGDELAKARQALQEPEARPARAPVREVPPQPSVQPVPEEDEMSFLDKPRSESRKEAAQVFWQGIQAYDLWKTRTDYINRFRSEHSDFDNYRNEIAEILSQRPDLNQDFGSLPAVYQMAKDLFNKRVQSAIPTTPQVNVEELEAKLRAKLDAEYQEREKAMIGKILEGVRKRTAAGGISTSGNPPVNPADRAGNPPKTTPQTPEEKDFQDMLNAGPRRLDVGV